MIRNLRDTTRKNTEQDWLKTNLAKFSRMLQGQRDLNTVGRLILSELAPVVSAQHALFYVFDSTKTQPGLTLLASYGGRGQTALGSQLDLGEGLVGQCAVEKEKILLSNVPLDYIKIFSGLGAAPPQNILVLPVIFEGQVRGVLELASFERFSPTHEAFLDQLTESIGIVHQHDRGQHADRRPAEAIAIAGARAAKPAAGAAADQPGAGGKGRAARAPEPGGGAQEFRGRAGAQGARGKGGATRADVEVQVRVPRQHVARVAHAAQFAAHPLRPAVQEPGREPHAEAGRVREDDPRSRQRPAHADQRHPRPVEDRIGYRGHGPDRPAARRPAGAMSSARSATSPKPRASTSSSAPTRGSRSRCSPMRSGCSRC